MRGGGEGSGGGLGAGETWGVWRSLVWLELELEWAVVREEPREVNRSKHCPEFKSHMSTFGNYLKVNGTH